MDKMLNYNSSRSVWMPTREVVAGHIRPARLRLQVELRARWLQPSPGLGYDWAIEQTGKALENSSSCPARDAWRRAAVRVQSLERLRPGHARLRRFALDLADASVDCVVIDPPYYDNVTYSELSDFFYVWLKRTAGLLFPDEFASYLTDKDHEAIANPFRFRGQKQAPRSSPAATTRSGWPRSSPSAAGSSSRTA